MEQNTEPNDRIVYKKYSKQSLQPMMLEQQIVWMQKKVESLPHTIYTSQFKMDHRAKCKS